MIFSDKHLSFLRFEFLQLGQNTLERLPTLLKSLLRDIPRQGFLRGFRQIDQRFGLAYGGIFVCFHVSMVGAVDVAQEVFRLGIKLLEGGIRPRAVSKALKLFDLRPECIAPGLRMILGIDFSHPSISFPVGTSDIAKPPIVSKTTQYAAGIRYDRTADIRRR